MINVFFNHIARMIELRVEAYKLRSEEKQIQREEELEAMNRALDDRRMKMVQRRENFDKQIVQPVINTDDIFEDLVRVDTSEDHTPFRMHIKKTEIIVSYTGQRVFLVDIPYHEQSIDVLLHGLRVGSDSYALTIEDDRITCVSIDIKLNKGDHLLIELTETSGVRAETFSFPIVRKQYSVSETRNEFMHRSWTKMVEVVEVGNSCGYFFDSKYLYILTLDFGHEVIDKIPIDKIANGPIQFAKYFSVQRQMTSKLILYIEGQFMHNMNDDEVKLSGLQYIEYKGIKE